MNITKTAGRQPRTTSAKKPRKPSPKRPFNLYLNYKLVSQAAALVEPRYGLLTLSDLFNEFLARELREKGGLLRARLATHTTV